MPNRTEKVEIINNNVMYWMVRHNDRYIVSILPQQVCRRAVVALTMLPGRVPLADSLSHD